VTFSGTALVLPEGNVGFVDEPGVCDGVVIRGSEVLLIFSGGERSTGTDVSLVLFDWVKLEGLVWNVVGKRIGVGDEDGVLFVDISVVIAVIEEMEKLVFAFSVESSIVVSELFEGDLFFTVIISIEVGIEDIVVVLEYSPDDRIEVFVLFVLLKSREFWTEEFASEVDVSPKVVASVGVGFESVVVIFESTADDNVVVSELSEGVVTLPTTGSDVVWIEEDIFVVEVPLKVVVSIEVGTEDIVVVFEISLDDRIDISVLFVVPLISRKVWIKEFASEVEVSLKVVASVGAADDNVVVSKLSVDVVTLPKSGSDALEEEFIGVNNVPLRIVGSAEVGREVVFENSVDNIRVSLKVVASVGVVSVNVVVIFEITTDGNVFASKLFVSVSRIWKCSCYIWKHYRW
jgi:hypothetical protein